MSTTLDLRDSSAAGPRNVAVGRWLWPLGIFALAILARAVWARHADIGIVNDSFFYFLSAESLAAGEGFRNPSGELTKSFAPGYPLTLASLFVVFGAKLIVAKSFNVVIAAAVAPIVYFVGIRVRDRRTGAVAGLIAALFPSQIFFSGVLMTEPLFATLVALLVLLLIIWHGKTRLPAVWQAFALGLLLGYMSLIRAEALLLIPAVAVLWKLLGMGWGRLSLVAALLSIGAALVIAPWTVRNYAQFDEFVLIRGNEGDASRLVRLSVTPDFDDRKYQLSGGLEPPPSFDDLVDYYRDDPSEFVFLGLHKVRDLYGTEEPFFYRDDPIAEAIFQPRIHISSEEARLLGGVADGYYYATIALAVAGAPLWFSRRNTPLLIVLWFIACWSAMHLAFVPQNRYHYPVLPMVSVIAAGSAAALFDRLRTTRRSQPVEEASSTFT